MATARQVTLRPVPIGHATCWPASPAPPSSVRGGRISSRLNLTAVPSRGPRGLAVRQCLGATVRRPAASPQASLQGKGAGDSRGRSTSGASPGPVPALAEVGSDAAEGLPPAWSANGRAVLDASLEPPQAQGPRSTAGDVSSTQGGPLLTWSLVLGLLWKQKLRVAVAAVALVLGTVCNICIPKASGGFLQSIISTNVGKSSPKSIARLLLPLATFYVLEPLCTLAYVSSLCSAWDAVVAQLRRIVFQRLLTQEMSYFDRNKVSELTALLSTELTVIEKGVVDNVSRDRGLRSLGEVSASLAMIFYLCPDLAPVLVLVVGGVSLSAGLYKRSTAAIFKAALMAQNRIAAVASETLANIRTVRSFSGEARQEAEFSVAVEGYEKAGTATAFAKSASEAWTRGTVYVSLVGIYALCGARVQSGQLAPGTLLSFVGYIFILTFAIQGFLNTTADLQNVFAAVSRINSLVPTSSGSTSTRGEDQTSSTTTSSSSGTSNGAPVAQSQGPCVSCAVESAWNADISFQGVQFSYPQRPDVEVLRGINLHLPRGKVTALVGGSGAGKTTVVQLLSRFYEPRQGKVNLGKWEIGWFDRSEWARAVSLVSQEPVLFAMSIRDNIAYGRPDEYDISMERIVAAAKAANAHDFIMGLPQGYDTLAGERGSLFSGGQRQRIAIARAILKDAPILILDEATSALDSVSERLVQEALDKLMKGRTTLVIAHRLSTVQQAFQIVVMNEGRVVEEGSHSELLRLNGAYAQLVNSQHLTFAS